MNPRFKWNHQSTLPPEISIDLEPHCIRPDRHGTVFSREAFGGYMRARGKNPVTLDSPQEELDKLRPEVLEQLRSGEVKAVYTDIELTP